MPCCVLSTLLLLWPADLRLQGVVVSPSPERSSALLSAQGRARVVAPGERALGALLVSVAPDRVVLEADGERRELALSESAGSDPAARPGIQAGSPCQPALDGGS